MRLLLSALIVLACAACEPAFVYHPLSSGSSTLLPERLIQKPLPGVGGGKVRICFNEDDAWTDVERMATEECARLGLRAQWHTTNRWQCRWTVPHEAVFQCVHVDKDGAVTVPTEFSVYAPAQADMEEQRLKSLKERQDTPTDDHSTNP